MVAIAGTSGARGQTGEPAASLPPPSPAARLFAESLDTDRQLLHLLRTVSLRSVPYNAFRQRHGAEMADRVLEAQLARAVLRFGPEWQRNMASVLSSMFSNHVIASLLEDGAESPFYREYLAADAAIQEQMQAVSAGLVRDAMGQIVAGIRAGDDSVPLPGGGSPTAADPAPE